LYNLEKDKNIIFIIIVSDDRYSISYRQWSTR